MKKSYSLGLTALAVILSLSLSMQASWFDKNTFYAKNVAPLILGGLAGGLTTYFAFDRLYAPTSMLEKYALSAIGTIFGSLALFNSDCFSGYKKPALNSGNENVIKKMTSHLTNPIKSTSAFVFSFAAVEM